MRGFLKRAGFTPSELPKSVLELDSAAAVPKTFPDALIMVSTIQLINDMARNRESDPEYDRIAKWCDAVFVDEGHYEPALSWSTSVRGLQCPIVLVTATPYRNDLKPFSIDQTATHVSTYTDLTAAHFLRKVDVVQAPSSVTRNPADFVNSVLDEFVKYYGTAPSAQRKLIIRCRTEEHIRQICELVRAHPSGTNGVLGLHEKFRSDPARAWERRQPSDPEAPNAPGIWVHQHKLLEGVDGPSFRALAFYGVLGSTRALVQQVGRVIRNPDRDHTERSLMIDHSEGMVEDRWSRFLEFDKTVKQIGMFKGIDELSKAFDAALPPIVYVDRDFRRRFSFGVPPREVRTSLRLPLRCHLYQADTANFSKLLVSVKDRLLEAEYPFEVITADEHEMIVLFEQLQSSPLLEDHYFMERELHVFVAQRKGQFAAILDTSRPGLDRVCALHVGRPLTRKMTQRLLDNSPTTKLVEINARNSALSSSTVRRRAVSADSLIETPPSLDDYQYVPSSVIAVDRFRSDDPAEDSFSQRSIGFGLARITDASRRKPLSEWTSWTDRLAAAASDGTRKKPTYLDRFAKNLDTPPRAPWPRNVLLDVASIREDFVLNSVPQRPIEIDDICLDCKVIGRDRKGPRAITLQANGVDCEGTFEYEEGAQRYLLTCDRLEQLYRHADGTEAGTIVDILNHNQGFVVIPESPNVVYSEGTFFDPQLGLGPDFDPAALGLDSMIITKPALRACQSEKGSAGSARSTGWPPGSVFHWIDNNLDDILPNAQLAICDDGGRETCDFILAGRKGGVDTVVMVHAKANGDTSYVSASSIHDVCAQTQKQLDTISQNGTKVPPQISLWDGEWNGPNGEGRVRRRIRRKSGIWAGLSAENIWVKLEEILRRPGTERQVAMVLGATLHRDRFFAQARAARPPAPAIHSIRLLRTSMTAVNSINGRLKVFCG
jgi:hypothetical protein